MSPVKARTAPEIQAEAPGGTVLGLSVGMERGSAAWLWSRWLDVVLARRYWWKHGFDTIRYKLQMTMYLLEEPITALLILIGQMPCPSCHSVHMYALHLHLRPIILRYYGKSQVLIILDMAKTHTRRCHIRIRTSTAESTQTPPQILQCTRHSLHPM
jgi:hypothetical protein